MELFPVRPRAMQTGKERVSWGARSLDSTGFDGIAPIRGGNAAVRRQGDAGFSQMFGVVRDSTIFFERVMIEMIIREAREI